jgi:uncharacterized protein YdeI (BOF family)
MRVFTKLSLAVSLIAGLLTLSFGQAQQAQPPDPTGQSPTSPAPSTPPTFPPNAKQQPEVPSPHSGNSAATSSHSNEADIFSGTIVNRKDSYLLRSGDHEYKLDDQKESAKHKDQKVKITGSLDRKTNTIHVEKIEDSPDM